MQTQLLLAVTLFPNSGDFSPSDGKTPMGSEHRVPQEQASWLG